MREERFADTFELILAGRVDEEVANAFREPPFDRIVQFPGYLPHAENWKLLRSADLCLSLVGQERIVQGMLTGKLLEYLGSGTPILALAKEGEAAELIGNSSAGEIIDPDDSGLLKSTLLRIWKHFQAGERRLAEPDRETLPPTPARISPRDSPGSSKRSVSRGPPRPVALRSCGSR